MVNIKIRAFTTSEIAERCHHSRETVKQWLERGENKGYRAGISRHWRVMPKDLDVFLLRNSMQKNMEMSFLSHALLRRSDAYEEHGDVFFCGMPFT
jgi:excisionase family DNA binding protein